MSFFVPNRLTCFLCKSAIASRIDAAQLLYAHPDDVGDLARHGRAWVHRACWNGWELRETWATSALRLLTSDPANISQNDVVCRLSGESVLLQDPWQAVSISIPVDRLAAFIQANDHGGEVSFHAVKWTFELTHNLLHLTGAHSGEAFESLQQAPGRWSPILSRMLEKAKLGTPSAATPANEDV
jgi:hypothetical protein